MLSQRRHGTQDVTTDAYLLIGLFALAVLVFGLSLFLYVFQKWIEDNVQQTEIEGAPSTQKESEREQLDRLVRPSFLGAPSTRPIEPPPSDDSKAKIKNGGGGDEPPRHPLIEGLFKSLPRDGEPPMTAEDAADWLETAAGALRLVYKFKGRIRVEIEAQREIPIRGSATG